MNQDSNIWTESDAEQFTKGLTTQVYFTVFSQPEDKICNTEIKVKLYFSVDKS